MTGDVVGAGVDTGGGVNLGDGAGGTGTGVAVTLGVGVGVLVGVTVADGCVSGPGCAFTRAKLPTLAPTTTAVIAAPIKTFW